MQKLILMTKAGRNHGCPVWYNSPQNTGSSSDWSPQSSSISHTHRFGKHFPFPQTNWSLLQLLFRGMHIFPPFPMTSPDASPQLHSASPLGAGWQIWLQPPLLDSHGLSSPETYDIRGYYSRQIVIRRVGKGSISHTWNRTMLYYLDWLLSLTGVVSNSRLILCHN